MPESYLCTHAFRFVEKQKDRRVAFSDGLHIFLLKDHTDEGLLLKSRMKYCSHMERSSGRPKGFELMVALLRTSLGE